MTALSAFAKAPSLMAFVVFTGCLRGYHTGVISGAIFSIAADLRLSQPQQERIIGSLNIASAFGGLVGGFLGDKLGRRVAFGALMGLLLAGALAEVLAQDYWYMLAGRCICGLGIGGCGAVAPVYVAEVAPKALRGSVASVLELAIGSGITLGYVSALVLSAHVTWTAPWRVMHAVTVVMILGAYATLCRMPDSPRWLVRAGRTEEALAALLRFNSHDAARQAVADIEAQLRPRPLCVGDGPAEKRGEGPGVGREGAPCETAIVCKGDVRGATAVHVPPTPAAGSPNRSGVGRAIAPLADPRYRRPILIAFALAIGQQLNGSEAAVYYVPYLLQANGVSDLASQLHGQIAVGVCKTSFVLVAVALFDRWGRRPLLLLSTVGIAITLLGTSATFAAHSPPALSVAGLCLFMAFFSIGIGPGSALVASEVLPTAVRASCMSLAQFANRIVSGALSATLLTVASAVGMDALFLAFGVVSALTALFVYYFVPETKGKSLEELEEQLTVPKPHGDGEPLVGGDALSFEMPSVALGHPSSAVPSTLVTSEGQSGQGR